MPAGSQKISIVSSALRTATISGLRSVTIGTLASDVGMSKSGLFAHFGSKEDLQLQVISHAAELFVERVVHPVMLAPRGAPRLRALLLRHFDWIQGKLGLPACPFAGFQQEFDGIPGPARDKLAAIQSEWRSVLLAEAKLYAKIEPEQLVFELTGIALAYQQALHLLADPSARDLAEAALTRALNQYGNSK